MPLVSVDYTYNLPNEFLVDHSQSDGNTRNATYDGPDKIFLIINNETGKEEFGPITEVEKNDGRPVAEGCRYVEVDCIENPLLCQLRGPVVDEAEEEYDLEPVYHPNSPDITGYERYFYFLPLQPADVYHKYDISVDSEDNITIPVRRVAEHFFGDDTADDDMPTWDDIRNIRDSRLKASDSQISDDMPESLKEKWRTYRQRLRDLPTVMQANNVPPHIAFFMFPIDPDNETPPPDESPKWV